MPRFTASTSMGTFTVTDTANSSTVLSMAEADIHGDGSGATLTPTMSIVEIDRAFGTPYGIERETGFDLVFTFINTSGSAKQIGSFGLSGFNLTTPVRLLDTLGTGFITIPNTGNGENYPGTLYSPTITIQDSHSTRPYNITVALAYPVVEHDHAVNRMSPVFGGAGNVPSEIRFSAAFSNSLNPWFTIPDGAPPRRYRLMFRINDRTDTPIGSAADAPTEWLWTLRGYQQYFRRRFGKPDYRRMGGRDGRPARSFNTSPVFGTGNARGFNPENPTTTGGSPAGFFKFEAQADVQRGRNIPRFIIWALSGQHNGAGNYDFRFATQVASLAGDAPSTVRPALRNIRGTMQLGLYWGNSSQVYMSGDFDTITSEPFDPDDPDHVAAAYAELDLAIQDWRAQLIGLDAYTLAIRNPGKGFRWLRHLQRRYLHVMFVTEANLPDFLHTIAPTYLTEASAVDPIITPFWIQQYINPGNECTLQINGLPIGVTAPERATALAEIGLTPLAIWDTALVANTRASLRWRELGEAAIPGFDCAFHRPLTRTEHLCG